MTTSTPLDNFARIMLASDEPSDAALLVINTALEILRRADATFSRVVVDLRAPRTIAIAHDGQSYPMDAITWGSPGAHDLCLITSISEEMTVSSAGRRLQYTRGQELVVHSAVAAQESRISLRCRPEFDFDIFVAGLRLHAYLEALALLAPTAEIELRVEGVVQRVIAYRRGCESHLWTTRGAREWLARPVLVQVEGDGGSGNLAIAWGHGSYFRTTSVANGRRLASTEEDAQLALNAIAKALGSDPNDLAERLRRAAIGFDCVWSLRTDAQLYPGPTRDRIHSNIAASFLDRVLCDYPRAHAAMIAAAPRGLRADRLALAFS